MNDGDARFKGLQVKIMDEPCFCVLVNAQPRLELWQSSLTRGCSTWAQFALILGLTCFQDGFDIKAQACPWPKLESLF